MDRLGSSTSHFQGQGFQNSGAGNVSVGRDLNFYGTSEHDNESDKRCLRDLRVTDPRHDKKRIEEQKGGLLADSYIWIRGNTDFQRWRSEQESRVLWIKGDPGKGKTMLICGIINDLTESKTEAENLSFFFCDAKDPRNNNAIGVLRGLIYLLVKQRPKLISHVRRRYDDAGEKLFQDANAWFALSEILNDILQDPDLEMACLIIDALDECTAHLTRLLEFIVANSPDRSRTKWIVSSRNWPSIEEHLKDATGNVKLCLELNDESISTAVENYIAVKAAELSSKKKYKKNLLDYVQRYLSFNANNTFLWVSLVCQQLLGVPSRNVRKKLRDFPPGLDQFYSRMLDQVCSSDDAELCQSILAVASVVYRAITLDELSCFIDIDDVGVSDTETLAEIVEYCGSFLTLRENTIFFVHQSAKDYLVANASMRIFPNGCILKQQRRVLLRSIGAMQKVLQKDIYHLRDLGRSIDEAEVPDPDPLAQVKYACVYWLDHLQKIENDDLSLCDGGNVDVFLREHLLHWLEALSLLRDGRDTPKKLLDSLEKFSLDSQLYGLISDAHRFIISHREPIWKTPLPVYSSALLFSPTDSIVRILFQDKELDWIIKKPAMESKWNACLQTLRGHQYKIQAIAFLNDDTQILSVCKRSARIWDLNSGECKKILFPANRSLDIRAAVFTNNKIIFALPSSYQKNCRVEIWDQTALLRILKPLDIFKHLEELEALDLDWEGYMIYTTSFSKDATLLAMALPRIETIGIWSTDTGSFVQVLYYGQSCSNPSLLEFSNDNTQLLMKGYGGKVRLWDITVSGGLHLPIIPNGLLSNTEEEIRQDKNIKSQNFSTIGNFSNTSCWIALGLDNRSKDVDIDIWDIGAGTKIYKLVGHEDYINSVIFSNDSKLIASCSDDQTVKIWNIGNCSISTGDTDDDIHDSEITYIAISNDCTRIASGYNNSTIKIWNTSSVCMHTLEGHKGWVTGITFSNDHSLIVSGSKDRTVKIWNHTGVCRQTFVGHQKAVSCVALSNNSLWVASGSNGGDVRVWNMSGVCVWTFSNGMGAGALGAVTFSKDDSRIAWSVRRPWENKTEIGIRYMDASVPSVYCDAAKLKHHIIWHLKFDATDQYLSCNHGQFSVEISRFVMEGLGEALTLGEPQYQGYSCEGLAPRDNQGYNLSYDDQWITWNGQNIIWLPIEHRPVHRDSGFDIRSGVIAIGSKTNRLLIFQFSSDPPKGHCRDF